MPLLEQFSYWLGELAPVVAMRESEVVFPVIQTFHILGLGLLAGTIALVDLRLLGLIMRDQPADRLARQVLPLTWAGFVVMGTSGVLLFAAQAERIWSNAFLQAKFVLLLIVGLNMAVFHLTTYRRVTEWGVVGGTVPLQARIAAAGSLLLWAAIITAGRMIAYFS